MKTLILLAFMLIVNVFASEFCGDKSLSYCINHFDKQCRAKNYRACYVVGLLQGTSEAIKYYEMVCDKANSKDSYKLEFIDGRIGQQVPIIEYMIDTCGVLGIYYYNGWDVRQSYKKAFHYHNKACDLGGYSSCNAVGDAYYLGDGVRKSYEKAFQYYKKACDLEKSGVSCFELGELYHDGEGVKQNLYYAQALYDKACNLGYKYGCVRMRFGGADYEEILQDYKKTCDLGDGSSCYSAGSAYKHGRGVRQNDKKALQYWGKACDLGYGKSCALLGDAYHNDAFSSGKVEDLKTALKFYTKSCELEYGSGCSAVGALYYFGEGVKKDLKTALKFYTKSCELKYGSGCFMVGAFYHDGEVVKQNLSNAKEFYGKACDFGEQRGCDKYKKT